MITLEEAKQIADTLTWSEANIIYQRRNGTYKDNPFLVKIQEAVEPRVLAGETHYEQKWNTNS